ncbi:hypothetical protein [Shinella sumterensis]|uniref:hypothetical protein n=1 Tax=Shinella sumterensis TaxID=1967501 RepID=UPI003F839ECE
MSTTAARSTRHRGAPIRFRDEHGRECLKVPLDRFGRQYATTTVHGYKTVREAGAIGAWYLNGNGHGGSYVRSHAGGTLIMPARIIAGAKARSVVRYVNGDPLDLRPENIVLQRGAAKRVDAVIVADSVEADEDGGW